ncbi:methylamine utilization protein [Telluria mixta]|uniref:Methylamine utilization protein n=1 Tax=Telluria mixta TaxID=34071 RepID=A0ABT2BXT2_9BURK|nr:methylamine utilization protein [Telluria mixta]MCS0629954.1 methylamine utilization protein [Telluria mixta]WEM96493.1 methylamine utilization protein [Telluria mixta]
MRPLVLAALLLTGGAGAAPVEVLVQTPAGTPLADAAVLVEPVAGTPARPRARGHAAIEQRGREFIPWMTVVQTGTSVDFPNNDTIRHHVYSFSEPKRFEIKLYAGKPGQPVVFDKPGQVDIGCNIHDWMEAHVLVVDTPYFARTGADGRATVAGVPAGRYRVRPWHPLQKAVVAPQDIEIENGEAPVRMALVVDARPRQPKPHTEDDPDRY